MEAVVYETVGRAAIKDVPEPRVDRGQILIKVAYVGVCGTDVHVIEGRHNRATPPVVLGHEFSGVIAEPNGVEGWRAGDRVAVEPLESCQHCDPCQAGRYNICQRLRLLGIDSDGALAEYVAVQADRLHRVPDGVSLRAAAFVEPLAVVTHLFRRTGAPDPGDRVLVFGGGPIGAIAADVARAAGASTVVTERQAFRRDFAIAGGHELLDLLDPDGLAGFGLGLEATGTSVGLDVVVGAVGPGGRIGVVGLPKGTNNLDVNAVVGKEIELVGSRVYTSQDFAEAMELIRCGQVDPERFITRTVGLRQAISSGLSAVADGDDVMKVLVDVGGFDD